MPARGVVAVLGAVLAAGLYLDVRQAGTGAYTLVWVAALLGCLVLLFARGAGYTAVVAMSGGAGLGLLVAGLAGTEQQGGDGDRAWFGAILVLLPLVPLLLGVLLEAAQRRRHGRLARHGVEGVATLVALEEKGVLGCRGVKVRTRLRIHPAGGALPAFEVTTSAVVPPGAVPRAGDTYPVLLHRTDPRDWAFASATPDGRPDRRVPGLGAVPTRGLPPATPAAGP